jgi:hypothetical protein
VVQVRRAGVTWGDFFATLPMEVTAECLTTGTGERFCSGGAGELQFYVNGERDQGVLGRVIENGDQLLVSYGDENADEIEEQLERLREL